MIEQKEHRPLNPVLFVLRGPAAKEIYVNSIATQAISRETVYTVDCIVGTNSREFVAGCEGSKYWQTYPGLTKREFARELRRRGWKWTAQGWICGSCLGRHEAAR